MTWTELEAEAQRQRDCAERKFREAIEWLLNAGIDPRAIYGTMFGYALVRLDEMGAAYDAWEEGQQWLCERSAAPNAEGEVIKAAEPQRRSLPEP
jgi:hypothetical protein